MHTQVDGYINFKDKEGNVTTVFPVSKIENIQGLSDALVSSSDAISALADIVSEKVDIIEGKGLSTNDFTTAEKTKLIGIEAGATKISVDSVLSATSTNPVQGKVVYAALMDKADSSSVSSLASTVSSTSNKVATNTASIKSISERIDNIARLPEGSTTADAELIDIRVGADGSMHSSAGSAVRTQISNIQSVLMEKLEFEVVDEKGNPITDSDGNPINGEGLFVKTDRTLSSEYSAANAYAVGKEIENIKSGTAFPYLDYKSNTNYYDVEWGIPILELTGSMEGMTKKIENEFKYKYRSASVNFSGTCTMKWQGNSSQVYPKKNFTIKFDTKVKPVAAWGEHNKYCLKANFIDATHARNIISAKLWAEMVAGRETANYQPITDHLGEAIVDHNGNELQHNDNRLIESPNYGATSGKPVILALNGEFYGLYTLNIPKDPWMFAMEKGSLTSTIITSESNSLKASSFEETAVVDGTDYDIEYKSDDLTDDDVIASFNDLISAVINCDNATKYEELKQYVNTASIIDYIIHALLTLNTDWKKNLIWITYDNKKYAVSAYDMDTTFGITWTGTSYTTQAAMTIAKLKTHKLFAIVMKYESAAIKTRYSKVKGWIFSEEHVQDIFNNYESKIPFPVLLEDWRKWKLIPSTCSNNLNQIFNQYRIRIPYVDTEISKL